MLNEPTIEKLHAMLLAAMADAWIAQGKDPTAGALAFDERFAMLVDTPSTWLATTGGSHGCSRKRTSGSRARASRTSGLRPSEDSTRRC